MKVMIFTGGYFPSQKRGGPVTSLYNFSENLGDSFDIDVVCSNHELHEKTPMPGLKPGFNPVGKAQVLYIPDSKRRIKYFRALIARRNPDCLYMSSIFSFAMNFPLLRIIKKDCIKAVYAPRGELSDQALAMKSLKKKIYLFLMKHSGLYKNVYFQATSDIERNDIITKLGVPADRVFTLANLPSVPYERTEFTKKKGKLRIVFISRIHKSKNLHFALECASRLSGDITFDIYGPIEHEDYWEKCKKIISVAPDNVKIKYCGAVPTGQSTRIFSGYDCFLFPTLSENYSQAIAEAVLSGTVPVISRGTTPWDDLEGNGGYPLPLDNPDDFVTTLQTLCETSGVEYRILYDKLCEYRKIKLDTDSLCENYCKMFRQVTEK